MPRRLIVASIACLFFACGADTPTAPTPIVVVAPAPLAPASLVMSGSLGALRPCASCLTNVFPDA